MRQGMKNGTLDAPTKFSIPLNVMLLTNRVVSVTELRSVPT